MVLKHRAVQRFDLNGRLPDVVFELTRRTLQSWLARGKDEFRLPSTLGSELSSIGGGFSASFQRIETDLGVAARWRFLVGEQPHRYLSTITLHINEGRGLSWLWYDVESSRENSKFDPPRLTPMLTQALNASPRDRISGFTQGLRRVNFDNVGQFLDEVLEADDRVVPAFVSGSPSWIATDEAHVETALQPLYGLATFWKLAPDAFDEFNSIVAPGYSIFPGSIHSFQSSLDTGDELDARRHWWFSAAEVQQSDSRDLSRRLHTEATRSGGSVPLPDELRGLNEAFDKAAASSAFAYFESILGASTAERTNPTEAGGSPIAFEQATPPELVPGSEDIQESIPKPTTPKNAIQTLPFTVPWTDPQLDNEGESGIGDLVDEAASNLSVTYPPGLSLRQKLVSIFTHVGGQVDRLRRTVADSEALKRIKLQYDGLVREKAGLEEENEILSGLLSVHDQEAKESSDTLEQQRQIADRESRRAQHLAKQLSKLAARDNLQIEWEPVELASNDVIDMPAPGSVKDLLAQMSLLEHVIFTGEMKPTETITDARLREIILRDAWRFASELELYARQCGTDLGVSGMYEYMRVRTTRVTMSEFAADETTTLKNNKKFREPRTLKVPKGVDESGRVFMGAHFKLSQDNGKAMRMHFYDATSLDGNIYVGYIGPHLPSKKTT